MSKRLIGLIWVVLSLSLLVACNSPQAVASTDEPLATAIPATATLAVVAAEKTPIAPEPTPTAIESTATATATVEPVVEDTQAPQTLVTTEVLACRTLQNLNLRLGPGLSFDPPIRLLPADSALSPVAFSAAGFPGGQWIQVVDVSTSDQGWVSAGPQFVTCNFDLTTLPPAVTIPPTPTPQPTATPTLQPTATSAPVAGLPPRSRNNGPGGDLPDYAEGELITDDYFLFRVRIADTRTGSSEDGAGIKSVQFIISLNGVEVYSRQENNAAYCIFGGGEPNCNIWPQRDGYYVWGEGGPKVEPGDYSARIVIKPYNTSEAEEWNWFFDFTVSSP
jgi:hypothetical protein